VDIEIAGICHPDPLGRRNLIAWLRSVSSRRVDSPLFVAVEWDSSIFEQVKSQRRLLGELIREEWPKADSRFVSTLVEAMAFEGDAHTEVFPSTRTVWLDQGRDVNDPTQVSQFAQDRLRTYRSMLARSPEGDWAARLQEMSEAAWRSVNCSNPSSIRDPEFVRAICSEAAPRDVAWAIAVVGVCHARQGLGYLRDLLDEKGFTCTTTEIHEE
jgi:hypothetical protein